MKVLLYLITPFLFLACERAKDKDASDEKSDNTKTENVEEKKVEPVTEPPVYIAFREDQNGVVYLTDSDDDIDRLIVDLRPLGVEVALLERNYWKDPNCRRMSSRKCSGGCEGGNCNQVLVGGWNVCRCQ